MPVSLVMPVTEELVKLRCFQGVYHRLRYYRLILSYVSLP